MLYRSALYDDIDPILKLRMELLHEVADNCPPGLEENIRGYLESSITDGSCLCAVAEEDGVIAATAMLCCFRSVPDECNISGMNAVLASVYTLPQWRGNRYMEELLLFLLEEAKKKNIRCIYAGAERKAIPLYKRIGFQLAETMMYLEL